MQIALQTIILKVINRVVVYSIVFENCERLSFENMLLKEKVKILEEEKINLKKN